MTNQKGNGKSESNGYDNGAESFRRTARERVG
jgi:hypothetical protein